MAKSTALYVSATKNITHAAKLLLQMDRVCVQSKGRDGLRCTPLMAATKNATGRSPINGIGNTEIIEALLLAEGNDKAARE
jgi:hypothetical protein